MAQAQNQVLIIAHVPEVLTHLEKPDAGPAGWQSWVSWGIPGFNQRAGRWARLDTLCGDLCLEEDPVMERATSSAP